MIRHFYTLWSDHSNKSSTYLAPNIVIAILLAIFPTLYVPVTVFIIGNLHFLISLIFSHPNQAGEFLASQSGNYSKILPHLLRVMPGTNTDNATEPVHWTSRALSALTLHTEFSDRPGTGRVNAVTVEQGKVKGPIPFVVQATGLCG